MSSRMRMKHWVEQARVGRGSERRSPNFGAVHGSGLRQARIDDPERSGIFVRVLDFVALRHGSEATLSAAEKPPNYTIISGLRSPCTISAARA